MFPLPPGCWAECSGQASRPTSLARGRGVDVVMMMSSVAGALSTSVAGALSASVAGALSARRGGPHSAWFKNLLLRWSS